MAGGAAKIVCTMAVLDFNPESIPV